MATDGKLKFTRPADGAGTLRLGDWSGAGDTPEPPTPQSGGLVFRRLQDGSGKLVFGYTVGGGEPSIPDADVALDAGFADDASATIGLACGPALSADADFAGDMAASVGALWDANADRLLAGRANPGWQDGALCSAVARVHWQPSAAFSVARRSHWQLAAWLDAATRAHWQAGLPLADGARVRWQRGRPSTAALRAAFEEAEQRRIARRVRWQRGVRLDARLLARFQETIKHRRSARQHWQAGLDRTRDWALHNLPALPSRSGWTPHWQEARLPTPGGTVIHPQPPERLLCYDPALLGRLVFVRPFVADGRLVFICQRARPPEPPEPPAQIIVPVRRSYVVVNTIEIRRADDGTLLPAEVFQMELDSGSWTWSFSATFAWAVRDAVMPAGGVPVELEAHINGVPYRLQAERVARSKRFPEQLVRVSGRGKAAILDAPYAAPQSWAIGAPISAQQLMESVLTVGGVGFGWGIDFGLTDWTIPADAWAHHGTFITALNDIAGSVGAYLQPHATAATLRVLPRWPKPWWEWDTVTPDIELPAAAVELEDTEWTDRPAYNRVIVHGAAGGVMATVTREFTAGDIVRPTVVHGLITDADAARQRGIAELAEAGRSVKQTLSTMVLPETGLILPGRFVRYASGDGDRLGIVRSTSVDWRFPALTQTLTVESHDDE